MRDCGSSDNPRFCGFSFRDIHKTKPTRLSEDIISPQSQNKKNNANIMVDLISALRADREEAGDGNATNLHINLPSMSTAVSLRSLEILDSYHQINPNTCKHGGYIHFCHLWESFFMISRAFCDLGGILGNFVVFLQICNIRKWAGCWSVFSVSSSILQVSLTINSSFLLWE